MSKKDHITCDAVAASRPAEAGQLHAPDPKTIELHAREALTSQPCSADARLMLASALRRQTRAGEARDILEAVLDREPDSAFAKLELGLALGQLGKHEAALDAVAGAIDLSPTWFDAWCAAAELIAQQTNHREISAETRDSLVDAVLAARNRRLSEAESLLLDILADAPDYSPARLVYAVVLLAQEKPHLAIAVIDELVRAEPSKALYREMRASALHEIGEFHRAIVEYQDLLKASPSRPGAWISYGRTLQVLGRTEAASQAFRKSFELLPGFAVGWRMLAMLKSVAMTPEDAHALRDLLVPDGLLVLRRAQLHFALGKALEYAEDYGPAFDNYRRSNELQRARISGDVDQFPDLMRRMQSVFAPAFLRQRAGVGCEGEGPIFVVGMPRAGSTLVQEILAAHSSIESLGELRDLSNMAMRMRAASPAGGRNVLYPEVLASIDAEGFSGLGKAYLERVHARRKSDRVYFIDKLPENFLHAGLIHLMLPNARIIDVRRHPLDCCVSCFTNYLPEGPPWIHSLEDIGRYCRSYVELMAHFDRLLPGRIHRVFYEDLVNDPEKEVRRMLGYIGVAFEEECLRFFEREQAIRTISAEQARRPIDRAGLGTSRKFEAALSPLKSALGQVLETYPGVPDFFPTLRTSLNLRLS